MAVWVVISGLNQPDDLLFHDNSLYVGELGAGRIHVLVAGKPPETMPVTIPKVEGMVFINGTLYVSDQQNDRVDVVEGTSVRTVLQLTPVAGQDGVDNISAVGNQLLVPDSPNGTLLWVNVDGSIAKRMRGFVRPTGAWPLSDGSILVADEFGNAAYRVAPDGTRTALVRGLPIVDDVAADSEGRVFVVTPVVTGGRLAELTGGTAHDVVTGLAAPQGIAFDDANNVFVSESDASRVDLVIRSFKLVPVARAQANVQTCIDIKRAPGFTGSITLTGSSGLSVAKQPGGGSQGAVVATGCTVTPCLLTARSGGLVDRLWISSR
jgi:hypothetical protein